MIAHATETCYGFACDLTNPAAVERLFLIKKRSSKFPVSALFPSIEEAKRYVEWNEKAEELAAKHLPGPLTLILPMRMDAPQKIFPVPLVASRESPVTTLGIRISSHPTAMELAQRFGGPISTTSANIGGEKEAYSADEIMRIFSSEKEKPDIIIDSGTLPSTPPSTILRIGEGKVEIVRRGPLIF